MSIERVRGHDVGSSPTEVLAMPGVPDTPGVAPAPRGPLSRWVVEGGTTGRWAAATPFPPPGSARGDDLQLALYLCYEPHYSDVPGLPHLDEWEPRVIELRRRLEAEFTRWLRHEGGASACPSDGDVETAIRAVVERDDAPSVSRYMEAEGTLDDVRRFVIHRSAYQLKEADPHTFGIPHLAGRAKRLFVEIQAGEYGLDDPEHVMHSELFARTMRALDLDDRPHAYLDVLPAGALMISNLISLFGLHRRWRGALVGHLAVFEMTSVVPMGRYSRALRRLGAPGAARAFYDVHVLADAVHERQALELALALARHEPSLADDIVFGARSAGVVERIFAAEVLAGTTGGPWDSPRGRT